MADLYHALNRGVEKRTIFLDDQDRARFVHDMYEFNDTIPAGNTHRQFSVSEIVPRTSEREPLVDIHGWCLMGNHYHLLLSARVDDGLTKFLRKLNVGYAMYFNEKYKRSGTLFQGRTKKIHIATDAHFLHILHYIHLNPLDFLAGAEDWRTRGISSAVSSLNHLSQYRWSSYMDYCGKDNFPSIISKGLFGEVFQDYPASIGEFLKDIELTDMQPMLLE